MGLLDLMKNAWFGASAQAPEKKPGRNEACWCGSGRKYKKCHLAEDECQAVERACSASCGPT